MEKVFIDEYWASSLFRFQVRINALITLFRIARKEFLTWRILPDFCERTARTVARFRAIILNLIHEF